MEKETISSSFQTNLTFVEEFETPDQSLGRALVFLVIPVDQIMQVHTD